MTPAQWQQVRELLADALELKPEERPAFLDRVCSSDHALRREVEQLLPASDEARSSFLQSCLFRIGLAPGAKLQDYEVGRLLGSGSMGELYRAHSQLDSRLSGKKISQYQLLEKIGAGGMGEVYRAIRDDGHYRKEVAIKLVRAGQDSDSVVSRFKNERQILADLDHPNITRLLDGGTTDAGVPYLVMELIEGEPIDHYCNRRELSIVERLKLFLQVCSAVQYAHQRLIIHRDIKPSNILVKSDGTARLMDFGIAKILDTGAITGQFEATQTMFRVLTPSYASPEQIKGEPITTASDVYSLGVVLYELLTGHHPYHRADATPETIAHAACLVEPEKPSTAVRRSETARGEKNAASSARAPQSNKSAERLFRQIRGDLDNIILMALRKEPQRRYSSVEQLAEDIRRHLQRLPVAARKDTAAYRASKFISRHKAGVFVSAAVAALLLAALAVVTHEARIARQQAELARVQRVRAEQRFNDVRKLANALLFDVHDTIRDLPGSTPARKMIVEKSLQYLDSLSSETLNDPGLLRELATAYERVGELQGQYAQDNLGETRNSVSSYYKALSVRRQLGEAQNAEWQDRLSLAENYRRLATQLIAEGDSRSALETIRKGTTITESLSTSRSSEFKVLYELANDYRTLGDIQTNYYYFGLGDLPSALESYKKALAADNNMLSIDPANIAVQRSFQTDTLYIAHVHKDLDERPAALENFKRALQVAVAVAKRTGNVQDRRRVAVVYNGIAQFYDRGGDLRLSLKNDEAGLQIYKELAPQDPKNISLQQGLAIAYANTGEQKSRLGDFVGGSADLHQGMAIMKAIASADSENAQKRGVVAEMHINLAQNFARAGRLLDATREYTIAVSVFEAMHLEGPYLSKIAICKVGIGDAQRRSGDLLAATNSFQEALRFTRPHLKPTEHDYLRTAAEAYAGLGYIESARASESLNDEKRERLEKAIQFYRRGLEAWSQLPAFARADSISFNAIEVSRHLQSAKSELATLAQLAR